MYTDEVKKLYLVYSAIGALVVSGVNRGGQRTEMRQEGERWYGVR